ncbi:MAG: NUDIX domain-containing protein [Oricola sp.]|jgi:8-oxo-dGTP pyrophosphatase MutT (NUDIX family)|nr:NUDIX domain-containing protein [Oricola sp.]
MSDTLIPAATILLLRDAPAFEVLMVKRHADIAFAGGALVFPGGRIDAGDGAGAWPEFCDGLDVCPEKERAPRIAAIREAFEETGVLLARRNGAMIGAGEAERLEPWRKRVEADDRLFLEMIGKEGMSLAVDELHLFSRWRPGAEVAHRRYDTWFFAAKTPEKQHASPDGREATEIVWTGPQAVLADAEAGRRRMIFPTRRNVELLAQSDSAEAVFDFAARRDRSPIEPRIVERDGVKVLTLPEGRGYPVTEEPLERAMRF